jgi:hypothetical protein
MRTLKMERELDLALDRLQEAEAKATNVSSQENK